MNIIKKTFVLARRRPVLLLVWGAVFLLAGIAARLNPLFNLIFNFGMNGEGNIFEAAVTSIKLAIGFITGSGYLSLILLALTGCLVFGSLIFGVVFSGGFNIINNELKGLAPNSFAEGIKKYFVRVTVVNFTVLLAGTVYSFFMTVVTIPALVITGSWLKNKPQIAATAVFVDFITLMVLFFGFMFFRTFLLFWYPALMNASEKAFTVGKRSADRSFWPTVGGLTVFDITFLIVELLFLLPGLLIVRYTPSMVIFTVLLFIIKWIFETFFFLSFAVFIFERYQKAAVSDQENT